MEKPIAHLTHVGLSYDHVNPLFRGIKIQLMPGDFFFLTGASGSGKSSFLRLLYLDLLPTWGCVTVFGQNSRGLSWKNRMRLRQKIGVVFQEFKLLPHLSVTDNVALALVMRGLEKKRSRQHAADFLRWVGVEGIDRYPDSLSGGEKQRVSVARAVVGRPKFLLADEPTGNVDDRSALKLMYLFEELHKIGTTILIATHNTDLIRQFPHPTLHLENGGLTLLDGRIAPQEITYGIS